MTKCYLIGMGGTGAKCLESFIHLAASGLIGHDVWIGMVDQDESNGNVTRTKNLLRNYGGLHTSLRSGDNDLGQSPFLRSKVDFPTETDGAQGASTAVWAPAPGVPNLSELFSEALMVPDLKNLFHTFFDGQDRQTKLDVGFRGRPYLGATALQSKSLSGAAFWNDLLGSLNLVRSGLKVRIFLVASIFGGTGASGMPILARKLWERVKNMDNGDSFKVGGCMMLPYFSFPQVRGDGAFMNSSDFLGQTQGALKYYHHLFRAESFAQKRLFESLYFVGWNPLIPLDYEQIGNRGQENPSLLPELYAALSAARFFTKDESGYFYTSCPGVKETLSWNALPGMSVDHGDREIGLKHGLGSLCRFAFAFLNAYGPYMGRKEHEAYRGQPWRQKLIDEAGVDLSVDANAETLRNLHGYCRDALGWLAALCHLPLGEDNRTALVEAMAFAEKPAKVTRGQPPLRPAEQFDRKSFANLVHDAPASDLAGVFWRVNQGQPPARANGLGRFVGALHEACQTS